LPSMGCRSLSPSRQAMHVGPSSSIRALRSAHWSTISKPSLSTPRR
jgi:hypothetical protein